MTAGLARALAELGARPGARPGADDPGGRWRDLRKRTLSAVVLAPVALLCVWLGGVAWMAMMAAAAVGLGFEWATLCGSAPGRLPGVVLLCVPAAAGIMTALGFAEAALVLVCLGAGWVGWQGGGRWLAAGLVYVGVPVVALAALRGGGGVGRMDLLFLVLVVWASDIGAYVAGRVAGGPKLAPSISPGKTWSGAAGGLVAAMLVGVGAAYWLTPGPVARAAVVAGVLGVAAQGGDLLESWIKRRFGVKDSGWLIPGHGGLLDRLDGLLAAAPVAAGVAIIWGRGGALWN